MRVYMNGKFQKYLALNAKPITQRKWSMARVKAKAKRFLAYGILSALIVPMLLGASAYIVVLEAKKVFAFEKDIVYENTVQVVTQKVETEIPPILKKICKAESGCKHFDKNGQVLINKTHDVGAYQINVKIWGKKATELGYNLYDEKDNEAMALWIFNHYGSEPWKHSKVNWSK